jgi:hypothetical protein
VSEVSISFRVVTQESTEVLDGLSSRPTSITDGVLLPVLEMLEAVVLLVAGAVEVAFKTGTTAMRGVGTLTLGLGYQLGPTFISPNPVGTQVNTTTGMAWYVTRLRKGTVSSVYDMSETCSCSSLWVNSTLCHRVSQHQVMQEDLIKS